MPASRRACLRVLSAGVVAGLTGCTGTTGGGSPPTTPAIPESEQPARCRGDAVSGTRTVADPAGYGDGIEYDPENRSIRYQATGGGGSAEFETVSLAEWGTHQTATVATERAHEVAVEHLGVDEFGSGVSRPPESATTTEVVAMLTLTTRVRDGEAVERPETSLSALVEAAPRSVTATVTVEGDSVSRTVPVFADAVRMSSL